MNVTAPQSATRGSQLCITVTGAQSSVEASVEIDGTMLAMTRTTNSDGSYEFCLRLPADFKGVAVIHTADGRENVISVVHVN